MLQSYILFMAYSKYLNDDCNNMLCIFNIYICAPVSLVDHELFKCVSLLSLDIGMVIIHPDCFFKRY